MKQQKMLRLVESGLLLALATVLSMVKVLDLPYGGSITAFSALPSLLVGYRHGTPWGLLTACAHALIQLLLGANTLSYATSPAAAVAIVVLDYLLAFTVLGLGGIFRNCIKKPGLGLLCGSLVALTTRFLCHVGSGYILFSGWAEWFFTQDGFPAFGAALVNSLSPVALGWVYSLVYNGMYMVPEILLTGTVALILGRIPKIVTKIS